MVDENRIAALKPFFLQPFVQLGKVGCAGQRLPVCEVIATVEVTRRHRQAVLGGVPRAAVPKKQGTEYGNRTGAKNHPLKKLGLFTLFTFNRKNSLTNSSIRTRKQAVVELQEPCWSASCRLCRMTQRYVFRALQPFATSPLEDFVAPLL